MFFSQDSGFFARDTVTKLLAASPDRDKSAIVSSTFRIAIIEHGRKGSSFGSLPVQSVDS